jgi:hypothetical protein
MGTNCTVSRSSSSALPLEVLDARTNAWIASVKVPKAATGK